jgi:RNA polymerase sigma factor (sigma-70 family)
VRADASHDPRSPADATGLAAVPTTAAVSSIDRASIVAVGDDSIARPGDPVPIEPASTEPASIEQFLGSIRARAFRFAELGLRQREDALDAVQDAMMRMLGYHERPAAEWTALFWSILRRRIVDLQRRRAFRLRWLAPASSRGDGSDDVDWIDEGPDPARAQEGREAYARIAEALSALPRRQREAFTLRVLEELDVAGTALAMDCSEGSVKTHLSRAREALQRQLGDFR